MIIYPTTDLTSLVGARVIVNGVRTVRIAAIKHDTEATHQRDALTGGVWGDCVEDPHGDCRGGSTAFWWSYGTDLEVKA